MIAISGLAISILAIVVSAITAWKTLFHHGQIMMTQPTVIYFGPDGSHYGLEPKHQKVFFRTLLYSTGRRGQVMENMFIRLLVGETRQNLNIWVYGDDDLRRGSGFFVPDVGVATNHHFLPPPDLGNFSFGEGRYELEVFAIVVGVKRAKRLFSVRLDVTREDAATLAQGHSGLYFDWGPDADRYYCHVKAPPPA